MNLRFARSFLSILGSFLACTANAACDDAMFRQFDFWLGEWEVRTPEGKLAGTNRISREYDGCVIHERYTTPRGYSGESLNIFDVGRKVWHQTWVDTDGTLLVLEGRFIDDHMMLEGKNTDAEGKITQHRITWTPNADGTVRQFWQSTDATGTWVTAFDGRYTRKGK
jgi:hypothetical protein